MPQALPGRWQIPQTQAQDGQDRPRQDKRDWQGKKDWQGKDGEHRRRFGPDLQGDAHMRELEKIYLR